VKHLIRLYPGRWRQRYGAEVSRLLDDLAPMPRRARLSAGVDLLRGALAAHLETAGSPQRAAVRRAALVAVVVWAALSVEIVLTNVVFPTTRDDDAVSVLICYLAVFAALGLTGALAARVATGWRTFALAGAVAGTLIGAGTIATFVVVDNAFLGIVGQQQAKIDGLTHSGMSSMRVYVNVSLLLGFVVLSGFLAVAGAGLGAAGGLATRALPGQTRPSRASGTAGPGR
jgi:hypothetical protein